jgi:DNA-binding transcriptional ArsR family regulator
MQMSKNNSGAQIRRRCCNLVARTLEPGFFKALGDPNRIALLARLAGCCEPRTVGRLNECCPVDVSVVSRHLAILRDAGIVQAQRRGKEVYYSVNFTRLVQTLREMADAIETCYNACSITNKESDHGKAR